MADDTDIDPTDPMVAALLRTELLERCDSLIELLIVAEQDARVAAVAPFYWAAGRALCDDDDPVIRLEAMAVQIEAILQVPEGLAGGGAVAAAGAPRSPLGARYGVFTLCLHLRY